MSIRTLRFSFLLSCSISLFSTSWTSSAVVLDLEKELSFDKTPLENLLRLTDLTVISQADVIAIKTPQQAIHVSNILEQRFRQNGDIGAITILSPRILELTPDNARIYYLYAMALAAAGELNKASDLLSKREPAEDEMLYALLAKSALAKANANLIEATNSAQQAIALDPDHPYAYNILGQIAVIQKHYADAVAHFTKAIDRSPQFVAAYSNLGAIQLIQGDTAKAWQSYSEALVLAPDFCPALVGRATLASQLGDRPKAIKDLKTCIQSDPNNILARQRLIAIYLQQSQLDKARKLVQSDNDLDPALVQTTLGEIALRNNNPTVARGKLQTIEQDNAQKYYLISYADAMEHKFDAALHSLDQAEKYANNSPTLKLTRQVYAFSSGKPVDWNSLQSLASDPGVGAIATFLLGSISASKNDYKTAVEYWSRARDLLPGFILSGLSLDEIRTASSVKEQRQMSLGILFYLKAYYPAALLEFEAALRTNNDSFMANFFHALTLAQTAKIDAAIAYLLRSVKLTPEFFPANYMLAEYYLKAGDIEQAITYYRKSSASEPDQGVLIKLGLLYEGQGKTEDAAEVYRSFIQHHPGSFLGYNQLAWLYAKHGIQLNQALNLAQQADRLRPENASVNDTLGWIYFQLQDYALANQFLQKANKISKGKNPDILYHLAAVKVKQRDLKQAQTHLEQALAISERFESAQQAREMLRTIRNNDS